jgi:hypothetical protein
MPARRRTSSVGFELSLDTIYPQPFDSPLDLIVTEADIQRR